MPRWLSLVEYLLGIYNKKQRAVGSNPTRGSRVQLSSEA